jgi:hypothetical protein
MNEKKHLSIYTIKYIIYNLDKYLNYKFLSSNTSKTKLKKIFVSFNIHVCQHMSPTAHFGQL